MITQERLKQLLVYDSLTGWFTNRVWRSYRSPPGERAGSVKVNGKYRMVSIDGTSYYEHRLAWLYVYGVMPNEVDHIDGDGCNNVIANLRDGQHSQNMANGDFPVGVSGLRGSYPRHSSGKWIAKIQVDRVEIWLGTFDTPEEANAAFQEAADKYRGEYAFHNRTTSLPQSGTNG